MLFRNLDIASNCLLNMYVFTHKQMLSILMSIVFMNSQLLWLSALCLPKILSVKWLAMDSGRGHGTVLLSAELLAEGPWQRGSHYLQSTHC